MYALTLRTGKQIKSADLQRALAEVDCELGGEVHQRRMWQLGEIERLESRGMVYSNHDFDVLSAALNFLDAVCPEHALRSV